MHPQSGRVLLRWHRRQQAWLQVGGHGDPGETDPLAIALREAEEETGLTDLEPWPDARIRHVAVVDVPPGKGEPAHQHADVRFLLATRTPDAVVPEGPDAPLRWLSVADAEALSSEPNLRETLARANRSLAGRGSAGARLGRARLGPGASGPGAAPGRARLGRARLGLGTSGPGMSGPGASGPGHVWA